MGPIGQQPGKVLIHCLCHHLLDSQSDTQEGHLLLQSCIPYLKSGGYPPSYTIKEHGSPRSMAVLLLFSMAKAGCWSLGSGKFTFIPSHATQGQGEVLKGECAGELVHSCLGSSWAAWASEFSGNADEELETAL